MLYDFLRPITISSLERKIFVSYNNNKGKIKEFLFFLLTLSFDESFNNSLEKWCKKQKKDSDKNLVNFTLSKTTHTH